MLLMGDAWIEFSGTAERLRSRLQSCDIILSDLDGTDTASTGARETLHYLASHVFDENLRRWVWRAISASIIDKNINRMHLWHGFAAHFLSAPAEKERLRKTYTPAYASSLLYPGVREFYARFRAAEKIYITKTVYNIAAGFAVANGFDFVLAEAYDKSYLTHCIVKQFACKRRYLVKGDSPPDEAMLDVLDWHKKEGTIDDVIGINVCKDGSCINPRFDINIGRNYRELAALI